ncbi:Uncharacterized protein YR821_0201 [Yersinia ruckeri]|nr:Uncharacterized protein YR821_0201 [Yersinia ruckeri]
MATIRIYSLNRLVDIPAISSSATIYSSAFNPVICLWWIK